ncbi:MAG: TonB-dependent receptor family protein [Bacteroidetes bacterium]|nr:TonB-dependent receptor family protein [Bacteroidota bacterium]
MKNRSTFIFFFLLTLVFELSAQNPSKWQGKQGGGNDQEAAIIKGQIIDVDNESPLEFATVTVFSKKDSSMVTGGISDEKGNFQLDTKKGSYYAQVDYISFKTRTIEEVNFDKNNVANLGVVAMMSDAETLNEIEVRAEKSLMQISLDKKVFNVGKDLANRGGTAENILDNVPSIAVDIEGGVSLRGSGNVRILINGKPSGAVRNGNANGLRSIPANLIDRVEVITNPSARYEAEGMAGIINIVLKKEEGKGLNGSFDLSVGRPQELGGAINLNYRKKNFNWFTNIGVRYRNGPGNGYSYQEFYNQDTLPSGEIIDRTDITDLRRETERGGLSGNFRFGADYYFNPKNILTTALNYRIGDEDNFTDLVYKDYLNDLNNLKLVTLRRDDEFEEEQDLEYALTFKRLFEGKGHELVADVRYEEDVEEEGSDFREEYYQADFLPTGKADSLQRSRNKESNGRLSIQIDYVKPFSKDNKFELGYRSSFRSIDNDYKVEEFDDTVWKDIEGLSNDFIYDENIHAVYSQYGDKFGMFSYQVGVRAEYSDVTTELLETNEINPRDYFNLFPSAFLGYELANNNALQASYSRRIRRPRFWDLNPFFTFSDNRNFFSGNPDLDPEFTDSYEISHIKYWEKGSLSSAIYYRHTKDVIQRIRIGNAQDNTTTTRPENLATRDSWGFEFNYSYKPFDWWSMNGDMNFYCSITEGTYVSETETLDLYADAFSWNGRLTSKMTVFTSIDFQLTGNYRAPRETTQGRTRAMYHVDLGFSKDILKNNGTLTLSVRDLLNSRKRRYTNFGDDFFSEGEFQWRQRQITMSLNYRINQKKKRGGNRGGYNGGGMDGF